MSAESNEVIPVAGVLSVIERAAKDPAVDIDKLERLFALHERMVAADRKTAYNAAMSRVQALIEPVYRDAVNSHTSSTYARLETISTAISPIYTAEGFSLSFDTDDSPKADHLRLICDVMHSGGHTERKHFDLPYDIAGAKGNVNKTAIQGNGSTVSYGRRYLTLMVFNVPLTNDENDGNDEKTDKADPRGDMGKDISEEAALAEATVRRVLLAEDVEERIKMLHILDHHDILNKDQDLYVASSRVMASKERSAWNKYVAAAKKAQKEDAASDPNRGRW